MLLVEIQRGTLSRVQSGQVEVVAELGGGPNGAAIGPDGACYICNNGGFEWIKAGDKTYPGEQPRDYSGGRIERVDLVSGAVTTLYTQCEGQPLRGPNDIVFDQTGGFGPWIVTPDELPPGAQGLKIEMRLNGQVMQHANTNDMVFDVVTTLVQISECMTLQPGDCIAMGTPSGVGYPRNPPVFLQDDDIAEVEVEGIGILKNGIALEA